MNTTYGDLFESVLREEMPYKDGIKIGETLSFLVNGVIIPVQVTQIGWDSLTAVSLDLRLKFDIPKWKWIKQRGLLSK